MFSKQKLEWLKFEPVVYERVVRELHPKQTQEEKWYP